MKVDRLLPTSDGRTLYAIASDIGLVAIDLTADPTFTCTDIAGRRVTVEPLQNRDGVGAAARFDTPRALCWDVKAHTPESAVYIASRAIMHCDITTRCVKTVFDAKDQSLSAQSLVSTPSGVLIVSDSVEMLWMFDPATSQFEVLCAKQPMCVSFLIKPDFDARIGSNVLRASGRGGSGSGSGEYAVLGMQMHSGRMVRVALPQHLF